MRSLSERDPGLGIRDSGSGTRDRRYRRQATGYRLVVAAWRDGWRRVLAAPMVAGGVFVMTVLLALPLAAALRDGLGAHLGSSLAAEAAAQGVDYDWWQEFSAQATGIGTTFSTSIIGFAAVLQNIGSVLDGRVPIVPVGAAVALYLAGWTFLSGGILDRYARQRATRVHGFFAAAGVHFFRLLRLGAIAALIYWWLFAYVHPWLFDEQFVDLTQGMSVERDAALVRAAFYALFGIVLVAVNVLFDYAKIRIVVEDRRSALGGLAAALRFVRRHAGAVLALYALNGLVFLVLLASWALVAPGVWGDGASMWLALALAQLYLLARLLLKLQFMAAQTALFQSRLAHASYVGAPVPAWPESPEAEAISR